MNKSLFLHKFKKRNKSSVREISKHELKNNPANNKIINNHQKHKTSKGNLNFGFNKEHSQEKSVEKSNTDAEHVDKLIQKIKQLKKRVSYFENQHNLQGDYAGKVWNSGDILTKESIKKRRHSGIFGSRQILMNYIYNKNQRSIYATNKNACHPAIYTSYREFRNKRRNSNTSIMSNQSEKSFVKVNSNINVENFRTVATEFIEQAEELKAKISYILECCGQATSTNSKSSSNAVQTESLMANASSTCSYNSEQNDDNNQQLHNMINNVNTQYAQITKILCSIEKRIINLSETESKINLNLSSNNKGTQKGISENYPLYGAISKKNKKELTKLEKQEQTRKKLEPVVLVYEPIQPEERSLQEICKGCGNEFNSCVDSCNSAKFLRESSSTTKGNIRHKQKEKIGFVVMYTPDIQNRFSTEAIGINEKKKIKRKTAPCFWF